MGQAPPYNTDEQGINDDWFGGRGKVLWRENELGWRLHKHRSGYAIRQAHPPLRSRVLQFGPIYVNVVLVFFLWFRDAGILPYVLSVVLVPFISASLLGGKGARRFALGFVPGLLIFLALVVREDIAVNTALGALPLSILISLYLRPIVMYINVRLGEVTDESLASRAPFPRLKVEIDRRDGTQLYSVHIEDTESRFRQLAWESATEEEATGIAEAFRKWGIGAEAAQGQDNVIKADKRIRKLVMVGYIVAVVILVGVLVIWAPRVREKSPEGADLQSALLIAEVIIGFLFLSILPLGLYLCRFGWRVIKHQRMPPPGTTVIMDTRILEGKKAVMRGRIMMALSGILMAASLLGGLYFPHRLGKVFMEQIISGTSQPSPSDGNSAE